MGSSEHKYGELEYSLAYIRPRSMVAVTVVQAKNLGMEGMCAPNGCGLSVIKCSLLCECSVIVIKMLYVETSKLLIMLLVSPEHQGTQIQVWLLPQSVFKSEVEKSPDQVEKTPDQVEKSPDLVEKSLDQVEKSPDQVEKLLDPFCNKQLTLYV